MELNISQEELTKRVVEATAGILADELSGSRDAVEAVDLTKRELEKRFRETVEGVVEATIEKTLKPLVEGQIEDIVLQETNTYGEKRGEPLSFREYIVARAEKYLLDQVDYEGKPASRHGKNVQTRIAHMIDKHLHHTIERALKGALAIANSSLAEGLEKTVKIKLEEISAGIKVGVTMPR